MVPLHLLVASALAWTGESNGVVYDFTAKWCEPCQQMSATVSKLEREGLPIQRVDLASNRELANRYRITNIPAFVLVIDDKEVTRVVGKTSEARLRQLCAQVPQKPVERSAPKRQVQVAKSNAGIDLGDSAPLPIPVAAPNREALARERAEPEEKPGLLGKFFGKAQPKPPVAPSSARAQNEELIEADMIPQVGDPLSATVRLRVKDPNGENYGTGTIVDSREGRALILTCGHIFRHWTKGSQIQVEVFQGKRPTMFIGTRVAFELQDDVGLISIPCDQTLPSCRIAPPGVRLTRGENVVSVGCSGGEDPTVQSQQITNLNRYSGGDNIECSIMPVQGRSGGGLFNEQGDVIGVCNGAVAHNNEGLYAGLKSIYKILDRSQLSHVYRPAVTTEQIAEADDAAVAGDEESSLGESVPAPDGRDIADAGANPRRTAPVRGTKTESIVGEDDTANPDVDSEDVVGAEVVIIINQHGKNGTPSKVVRLHRASRDFWERLSPELETENSIQETTLKQSRPAEKRRPVEARPAPLQSGDAKMKPASRQARRPESGDGFMSVEAERQKPKSDEPEPYRRRRGKGSRPVGTP